MSVTKKLDKWTNTIYIMSNPHYNIPEICKNGIMSIVKIGSSKYLPARYYNYTTYTPIKSTLERFYHLHNYDCYKIDDDFKKQFDKNRIHLDGGIEFYNRNVIDLLETYMTSRDIEFTKYEDISDFPPNDYAMKEHYFDDEKERLEYERNKPLIETHPNKKKIIKFKELQIDYKKELIPDQYRILLLTVEHFKTHNKGIWNLFCRYGKTRLSCLFAKYSNYNKILILVPSLYLVEQTVATWQTYYKTSEIIKVSSNTDNSDIESIKVAHQDSNIKVFITTYQSSYKFKNLDFDICIYDEAHRTTGDDSTYKVLLDSDTIKKKLFLTATLKYYNYYGDNAVSDDIKINSMDDISKYGQIIEKVSARKALELKRICPFSITTMKLKAIPSNDVLRQVEQSVNQYLDNEIGLDIELGGDGNQEKANNKIYKYIKENQMRYIRIAYGLIQTIQEKDIKHTITFHRYILGAKVFTNIIQKFIEILKNNNEISCCHIDGNMGKTERQELITNFQSNDKISILCSAKVLQEGVDIPNCDSVCFVDAKTSIVDCTQSLSRCLTYIKNKHSNIIIPFDETDLIETKIEDNGTLDTQIKLTHYAMDLRILLRNIVEIDDNIKEYFRRFIEKSYQDTGVHSIPDSEHDNPDFELCKCMVDTNLIQNLSDIAYDFISIAKQKIKGKYTSATDYIANVRSDFGTDLPINPDKVYRAFGWHGWNDYLGIDRFMPIGEIRKHMQRVNRQILNDGKNQIIISQKQYQAYAKENNMMVEAKPRYDNWCWLLLPNYDTEVEKYYKTKEEIIQAIKNLDINNITDYEEKYCLDTKLAPYEYLINGFYNKDIPIIAKGLSLFISSLYHNDEDTFF